MDTVPVISENKYLIVVAGYIVEIKVQAHPKQGEYRSF
jgi:hypothetical protein